ncbi:MAG: YbaB/EbfC family nucleoid-associated protein [Thiotrichales bacterium]|jgi:hypothetical protein|nr:YbaB/EbfC family nucleoid-associated protein [Thiotrichales bacterium]MBT3614031.1 YbaB/EbfC family nucleoid-associated protein [Thiotrichales bacterium]MBT3752400.1 YbaB/EbfC family nucleoid-associated protein [Thiotrichales bacterium]MBT3836916.1 YbaB/EbfC family nucleoid-associated protein [Thiotrichales bacterium]MBT4152473.1 YbaB/EbfC family nucleoid-associated protein [Thiotrichales bacterium]
MKGLGGLMQKAQKVQEDMKKAQEDLAASKFDGQSGGGLVKIKMTGRHEVIKLEIDDSLLDDDKDMLEDLIAAAINDVVHKIEDKNRGMMTDMTSGLSLPGGMKLPF